MPGVSLRMIIDAGRRLDELSTARLIGNVAEVVHKAQVGGQPLGILSPLAIVVEPGGGATIDRTAAPSVAYSAPERLRGSAGDRRSDVFALGVILWEALAHDRLFGGTTDDEMTAAVLDFAVEFRPPSEHNANVPAELDAICKKALARDPAGRYQSAKVMAAELSAVLDDAGYPDSDERIAAFLAAEFPDGAQPKAPVVVGAGEPKGKPLGKLGTGTQLGLAPIPEQPGKKKKKGRQTPVKGERAIDAAWDAPSAPVAVPAAAAAAAPAAPAPEPFGAATIPSIVRPPEPTLVDTSPVDAVTEAVPTLVDTPVIDAPVEARPKTPTPPPPAIPSLPSPEVLRAAAEALKAPAAAAPPPEPVKPAHTPITIPPIDPSTRPTTPFAPADAAARMRNPTPAPPDAAARARNPTPAPPSSLPAWAHARPAVEAPLVSPTATLRGVEPIQPAAAAHTSTALGTPAAPLVLGPIPGGTVEPSSPSALSSSMPVAVGARTAVLGSNVIDEAARLAAVQWHDTPPAPRAMPGIANAETMQTPAVDHGTRQQVAGPSVSGPVEHSASQAGTLPVADEGSAPHPAAVVALPRAKSRTDQTKGDMLGGWGWGTDSHEAIYDDDYDDSARASKRRLLIAIGGAGAAVMLIAVIAFALSGSSDKAKPEEPVQKAATWDQQQEQQQQAQQQQEAPPAPAPAPEPAPAPPPPPPPVEPAVLAHETPDVTAPPPPVPPPAPAPEPPAPEPPKPPEVAKVEPPKPEPPKAEPPKPEPPKPPEIAKAEPPKPEPPKPALVKPEPPKPALAKPEPPKLDPAGLGKPEPPKVARFEPPRTTTAEPPKPAAAPPKKVVARRVDKKPAPQTTTARPIDPYATPDKRPAEPKVDPNAAYRTGFQQYVRGDSAGALATFKASLASNPSYAPTWRGIGLVYEKLGKTSQARTAYRRYLQLSPTAGDADQIRERLGRLP